MQAIIIMPKESD